MQAGYDALLRDKTRPSRIPPLGSGIAERVVTLTHTDPLAEATHWTATHDGESSRRYQPCQAPSNAIPGARMVCSRTGSQQFELSNDPSSPTNCADVVGLYVDPPAHAHR